MKQEMKEYLTGVLTENRNHPPKARKIKCGQCRNFIPRTLTCSLYPNGIPKTILVDEERCDKMEAK